MIQDKMVSSFVRIIHKLDDAYLGLQRDEIKRQRELKKGRRGFGKYFGRG